MNPDYFFISGFRLNCLYDTFGYLLHFADPVSTFINHQIFNIIAVDDSDLEHDYEAVKTR